MGIRGQQTSKEEILEAIIKHNGIVKDAAASLGVSKAVIYRARDNWFEVEDCIKKCREEAARCHEDSAEKAKDLAWEALHMLLTEKDNTSVIFTLKTLGKLTEKHDHNIIFKKIDACDESSH